MLSRTETRNLLTAALVVIAIVLMVGVIPSVKDDQVMLSDRGAYWLHAFGDFFSIDYIGTLWGTSYQEPWPEKVVL
jgi:hypothetical protein